MKIKARLDKIEQALYEADTAGKPVFRVFHQGEEIPPPERGVLHVVFQMPKPKPVSPLLKVAPQWSSLEDEED